MSLVFPIVSSKWLRLSVLKSCCRSHQKDEVGCWTTLIAPIVFQLLPFLGTECHPSSQLRAFSQHISRGPWPNSSWFLGQMWKCLIGRPDVVDSGISVGIVVAASSGTSIILHRLHYACPHQIHLCSWWSSWGLRKSMSNRICLRSL